MAAGAGSDITRAEDAVGGIFEGRPPDVADASRSCQDLFPEISESATDDEKEKALLEFLRRLSEFDPEGMSSIDPDEVTRFSERLYGSGFRHMYSHVSGLILKLVDGDSKLDAAGRLVANLQSLTQGLPSSRDAGRDDPSRKLLKLFDHASLEMTRTKYLDKRYDALRTSYVNLSKSYADLSEKIKVAEEKAGSMQREYVGILGILAAVVLVFNGAITFSVGGVNAVSGTHPFHVALILSIVGFVLMNTVAVPMTFLRDVVFEPNERRWPRGYAAAFAMVDALLFAMVVFFSVAVVAAYMASA